MGELTTVGQMQTADRSFFAQSDRPTDGRMDGKTCAWREGGREEGRGRDEAINKVDVSRGMLSWGSVVFRRDGVDNPADGAHDDNGHNLG